MVVVDADDGGLRVDLVVPYFLLWIIYFAQIVISIFRVMMLAALIVLLGAGFSWGRDMWRPGSGP